MKTFISPRRLTSNVGGTFKQVATDQPYVEGVVKLHVSKFGEKLRFFPDGHESEKFPPHCTLSAESLEILGDKIGDGARVVCRTTKDEYNGKPFTVATLLSVEEITLLQKPITNYTIIAS